MQGLRLLGQVGVAVAVGMAASLGVAVAVGYVGCGGVAVALDVAVVVGWGVCHCGCSGC